MNKNTAGEPAVFYLALTNSALPAANLGGHAALDDHGPGIVATEAVATRLMHPDAAAMQRTAGAPAQRIVQRVINQRLGAINRIVRRLRRELAAAFAKPRKMRLNAKNRVDPSRRMRIDGPNANLRPGCGDRCGAPRSLNLARHIVGSVIKEETCRLGVLDLYARCTSPIGPGCGVLTRQETGLVLRCTNGAALNRRAGSQGG